jgi:hypothetical protein
MFEFEFVLDMNGSLMLLIALYKWYTQSLARASSLRAKFERWEAEENERNSAFEKDSPSIESTKDLRAKFENLKREEEEKQAKRAEVKVNRFVVRHWSAHEALLGYPAAGFSQLL